MLIPAFAKINLTLEILNLRTDGFHEVKTILQTVDLADQLDIQPWPTLKVECDLPGLDGKDNLVWQAATALADCYGISPQARIIIRKRIPVGMGLGGGSSNAAAALIGLSRLWNLPLGPSDLTPIASRLGSDVPFFLYGGTALAEGRGDEISPLPSLPPLGVLLVCPTESFTNKTAALYSRINAGHYSDGGITRQVVGTLMSGQLVIDMLHNVFEQVAFQTFSGLNRIFQTMSDVLSATPHLSGAGPALFHMPASNEDFERVSRALPPRLAQVFLVQTTGPLETGGQPVIQQSSNLG